MRMTALALGLAVLGSACASKGTAATDQTPTAATTRSRTNVITAQEVRESAAPSLADVVRQLRPGWPNQQQVHVFVNEDYFGSYESLRQLSKSNVREVRHLQRSEVQIKWGQRYQYEAIQVITR